MSVLAALLLAAAQPPVIDLPRVAVPQGDRPRAQYQDPQTRLDSRLERLAAADDAQSAQELAGEVRSLWRQQAGPAADLLLQRAETALEAGDDATAERAYYHLRLLEPGYSEAWVASAELAARRSEWDFALEALNTAVSLDADRFDAWALLGRALETADAREAALEAYEEALARHPFHPTARSAAARLQRELAGRAL
jgi:tetratricopeptide (TPR) repeat protein